jgi:murein DD-endopeptidase MepM/ murein hydrolase activator NlpD
VACNLGETCFVQTYVDADPQKDAFRDFTCGGMSYDGHDGTDFRVRSLADGPTAVLAAAAGTVLRTRDGEPEWLFAEGKRTAVSGAECGNGVFIDHGGGWTTQYCHMAKGSLVVKPGQKVQAGAPLGAVGMSGQTEFPHVHLTVRRDGRAVDPFAMDAPAGSCGGGASLWQPALRSKLAYTGRVVLNGGFASGPVTSPMLDKGLAPELAARPDGAALVGYVRAIGLRQGDLQHLEVLGPDGKPIAVSKGEPLPRHQAQAVVYAGRKRPETGFAPGEYVTRYRVEREGKVVLQREFRWKL